MRVICIHVGTPGGAYDSFGNQGVDVPPIFVGNPYTVVDQVPKDGLLFYELEEVPPSEFFQYLYNSKLFASCSDVDETELINEREEVYAG